MKFLVLSRTKAKEYSYKHQNFPFIIISITDIDSERVVFNKSQQLKAVLRLNFDDVDNQITSAISPDDAKKIVAFVKSWINHIELIIVHCEAGMSRSSGVCAALMLWINGDDTPIFGNAFFRPNMLCYRTVLNELLKEGLLNG